ncbi:LPXTG cell wall anchor domain-containing protein [Aerococcaceae bacterium WGS1372]
MNHLFNSFLLVILSFLQTTVAQVSSLPNTGETSSWIYIIIAAIAIIAGGWLVFSSRKNK